MTTNHFWALTNNLSDAVTIAHLAVPCHPQTNPIVHSHPPWRRKLTKRTKIQFNANQFCFNFFSPSSSVASWHIKRHPWIFIRHKDGNFCCRVWLKLPTILPPVYDLMMMSFTVCWMSRFHGETRISLKRLAWWGESKAGRKKCFPLLWTLILNVSWKSAIKQCW